MMPARQSHFHYIIRIEVNIVIITLKYSFCFRAMTIRFPQDMTPLLPFRLAI